MREGSRTVGLGDIRHLFVSMDFVEIGFVALGRGLDGLIAGVPVCGANLESCG